jgi:hypothetical protein
MRPLGPVVLVAALLAAGCGGYREREVTAKDRIECDRGRVAALWRVPRRTLRTQMCSGGYGASSGYAPTEWSEPGDR